MICYLRILVNGNRRGPVHADEVFPADHLNNLQHRRLPVVIMGVHVKLQIMPVYFLPPFLVPRTEPD